MSNPTSAGAPIGMPSGTPGPAGPVAGPPVPGLVAGAPLTGPTNGVPGSAGPAGQGADGPTWRDLPKDPPFGPIPPMRAPVVARPASMAAAPAAPPAGDDSEITPVQIAIAVFGVLFLLALGVAAALVLLGDDDPVDADSPLPAETADEGDGDPFGTFTPSPNNPAPAPEPPAEDDLADGRPEATPSPGELEPAPAPSADGEDPGTAPEDPSGEQGTVPPSGDALPPQGDALPSEGGTAPEAPPGEGGLQPQPAPQDPEDGDIDLPLLFDLTQLPSGTAEDDTTVTQTSTGNEATRIEQVTHLDHPLGDITVLAVRAEDAARRLDVVLTDEATEVSVRGQTAYLLEGQRIVWLVDGDPDTYLDIDGPADVGTDELLTIANGLELAE